MRAGGAAHTPAVLDKGSLGGEEREVETTCLQTLMVLANIFEVLNYACSYNKNYYLCVFL